jgi:hypothetical protein
MGTVNSGITIRLLPRTLYAFGGATGLVAGGTVTVPIARHIDASTFTEGELMVRAHSGTSIAVGGGGGNFGIEVFDDGYDFEDPAVDFVAGLGLLPINNATPIPFFGLLPVASPFGRLVGVQLIVNQNAANAALSIALSVDLVLKGGDPSALPMMPNGYRGYRIM